jgi:hypothetical protein
VRVSARLARWFVLWSVATLVACGGDPAPTPLSDVAATQTRTSELTDTATATTTAPAAPAEATTIPVAPSAAPLPTATGQPAPASAAPATTAPASPTQAPATPAPPASAATPTVRIAQAPPPITRDQTAGQYGPVDAREIAKNPASYDGKRVIFTGTLRLIRVASPGQLFPVNDYRTGAYLQLLITSGPGSEANVTVFVLYDGKTEGMVEGSTVAIFALGVGTYSFQSASGATVTQALFYAQFAEILD